MNFELCISHNIIRRIFYLVVLISFLYLVHSFFRFQHDHFVSSVRYYHSKRTQQSWSPDLTWNASRLDIVKKFRTYVDHVVASYNIRMSDKFNGTRYFTIYGTYLHSTIMDASHSGKVLKLLDIGLGCGRSGHPDSQAAKIELLRAMYPYLDLWVAEHDSKCAVEYSSKLNEIKVSVVVGDQSNPTDLHRWVKETGGKFDFIIDDGDNTNNQILTSFNILFQDALNPGGLYFIEDWQIGHSSLYVVKEEQVVSNVLKDWMGQLLIENPHPKYPIPKSVKWIGCQREACVIEKEDQWYHN